MNILIFSTHAPYEKELARTGHTFFRIENSNDGWYTSDDFRPNVENIVSISRPPLLPAGLEDLGIDMVLAQSLEQAIMIKDWPLPKAAVIFSPPFGADMVNMAKMELTDMPVVFLDETARRLWRFEERGMVIPLSVSCREYFGYTGEERVVLTVCSLFKERDFYHGYTTHQMIVEGLPHLIVGANPSIPESRFASYSELLEIYRRSRVYLNTGRKCLICMAMLEAMATGCPVVTTSTMETRKVIKDGVNGYISNDPLYLKRRVIELLNDPERARRLGRAGRATAQKLFNPGRFISAWNRLFEETVRSFRRRTPIGISL